MTIASPAPHKHFSLIGYACGDAADIAGCDHGPRVLRSLKLVERLERMGLQITDLGDATPDLTIEEERAVLAARGAREEQVLSLPKTFAACTRLYEKTSLALRSGTAPLIIGGDHSLSIGSVAAVSDHYQALGQQIGLIWVDSHADINTPETSPSHNIFGMSMAFLLGMIPGKMSSLQRFKPALKPENVAYIGLRDIDPEEKAIVRNSGVTTFTMKDVDMLGMPEVIRLALDAVTRNTGGYVVSFDLDVCDAPLVPGTGLPLRGGLTYREIQLLMERIYDDARLLALEMVELNPLLDKNFTTAELAMSLIESALGKSIL